jgi:hypothetical protein
MRCVGQVVDLLSAVDADAAAALLSSPPRFAEAFGMPQFDHRVLAPVIADIRAIRERAIAEGRPVVINEVYEALAGAAASLATSTAAEEEGH